MSRDEDRSILRSWTRVSYAVLEGIRVALESLRANLVRSGLTVLGVAIGVVVVVMMAALVTGIRTSVADSIEAAGPRTFFVMRFDLSDIQFTVGPSRPPWWNRPPITLDEARRIDGLPGIERAVFSLGLQDPGAGGGMTLEVDGTRVTGITGAAETESWPAYRRVEFVEGRNFVRAEVNEARSVIVISRRLADDLFQGTPPLGRRVVARAGPGGPTPLTVVGVFEPSGGVFDDQVPHIAIVPFTVGLRRMKVSNQWGQLAVVPRDDISLEAAEDQVIGLLRSLRGLSPGDENNFSVMRSTQLLELFDRFTAVFFAVMIALSSIGLLVGGIGVIGIMMISVTERTREIGIRKAVGATPIEILWQFLVEAGVLTFVGGAVGLLFGIGLAQAIAMFTPVPAFIPLWAIFVSLAAAIFTGMVFGLFPALRAARMAPVQALRHE